MLPSGGSISIVVVVSVDLVDVWVVDETEEGDELEDDEGISFVVELLLGGISVGI